MSINWSNFHKKELIVRMLEEMNIPLCLPLKKKNLEVTECMLLALAV